MKHLLHLSLCLLLSAGCETRAAELAPGFVHIDDLDPTSAANVNRALERLPLERQDIPRLEYMPRTLVEARRSIEMLMDVELPPFAEACLVKDWALFSPAAAQDGGRFESGWALERSTLELYSFGSGH